MKIPIYSVPYANAKTNPLKMIKGSLNGTPTIMLIDSGASKSCVTQSFPNLSNCTKRRNNAKLLCANGEQLPCTEIATLKLEIGCQNQSHDFLIVPNLSAQVILGLDFIRSLEINDTKDYVVINGDKIFLHKSKNWEFGKIASTFKTLPRDVNMVVKVKNPFHGDKNIKYVSCDKFDQQRHRKYIFNSSIHNNDEFLNVVLSNNTNFSSRIHKGSKICKIEPFQIDSINGLLKIDDIQESNSVNDFQLDRLQEYGIPDEIKVNSYGENISTHQRSSLQNLLREKHLALAKTSSDIGRIGHYRYTLPMINENETAYIPPRPIPPNLVSQVDDEIQKFKDLNIISPSESGFNIPLLILKKSDGTLRISLDARQLNSMLVPDRFPLPSMPELLSKVSNRLSAGKECFVTSLDVNKAYWQLKVNEKDSTKLSFSYKNKHYKADRMLYGLSTAPSAWSKVMQEIFGDNDHVLIYLDDCLIISSSFEEHLKDLRWFFDKCIQYGITLSPSKINLCQPELEFLGHKIDAQGIKPLDKHIEALKNFPTPTCRNSLKRFVGMAQFNGKLVKDSSVTLSSLHRLCSAKVPFIWTDTHQQAFEKMKLDLQNTPGLKHRNLSLPLFLSTDASGSRCGATLYQKSINGEFETIGYFSKVFSPAEMRLSSRHREILALSYGIKHFEFHLIGANFHAFVDHKSMLYLFREHYKSNLTTKMQNVLIYLQQFNFKLIHLSGQDEKMISADCLSRLPINSLDELEKQSQNTTLPDKLFMIAHLPAQATDEIDASQTFFLREFARSPDSEPLVLNDQNNPIILTFSDFNVTRAQMIDYQKKCNFIKDINIKLEQKSKSAVKNYQIKDGMLYRRLKTGSLKIVLSDELAIEFLSYLHSLHLHPGNKKLAVIAQKFVYIKSIHDFCARISSNCLRCLSLKPTKTILPHQIKAKPYEAMPFAKVGIDLYDLGLTDRSGKRYLFTLTDHLTNYCDGIPISNKTDQLVSKAFAELILRYGICGDVILDNGQEFNGPQFRNVCKKFKLNLHRISPYHSRSNGKAERSHREILVKQRLLGSNRSNWSCHWPFIQNIINNTPKESLDNLTPAECVFGRSLYFSLDYELAKDENVPKEPFAVAMQKYTNELWPALLNHQMSRYNNFIEKDGETSKIKKGDYVLVWKPQLTQGKLSKLWAGPYLVTKHYSATSFHLQDPETGAKYRRSVRHLRKIGPLITTRLREKYPELRVDNPIQENESILQPNNFSYDFRMLPFQDLEN